MNNLLKTLQLLSRGEFLRVWREVHLRVYKAWTWVTVLPYSLIYTRALAAVSFSIQTKHPVATESPDHLAPKGTMQDNSSNFGFIMAMDRWARREWPLWTPAMMDLGCSGGQLVVDFSSLGWQAVGIEGSNRSLISGRKHWPEEGGVRLFTADITKPFTVRGSHRQYEWEYHCLLITAWEVLEHIDKNDLDAVFENINRHLLGGGYFIASTTETSDIHEGVELHPTQWPNWEWKDYIYNQVPWLEEVDLGLKPYQMVRQNFLHPSFLTYRKVK